MGNTTTTTDTVLSQEKIKAYLRIISNSYDDYEEMAKELAIYILTNFDHIVSLTIKGRIIEYGGFSWMANVVQYTDPHIEYIGNLFISVSKEKYSGFDYFEYEDENISISLHKGVNPYPNVKSRNKLIAEEYENWGWDVDFSSLDW